MEFFVYDGNLACILLATNKIEFLENILCLLLIELLNMKITTFHYKSLVYLIVQTFGPFVLVFPKPIRRS